MNNDSITRIFCDADDFCAKLERYIKTPFAANRYRRGVVSTQPPDTQRGDDYRNTISSQRIPVFQMVLP
jgi:hypothetical protein